MVNIKKGRHSPAPENPTVRLTAEELDSQILALLKQKHPELFILGYSVVPTTAEESDKRAEEIWKILQERYNFRDSEKNKIMIRIGKVEEDNFITVSPESVREEDKYELDIETEILLLLMQNWPELFPHDKDNNYVEHASYAEREERAEHIWQVMKLRHQLPDSKENYIKNMVYTVEENNNIHAHEEVDETLLSYVTAEDPFANIGGAHHTSLDEINAMPFTADSEILKPKPNN